MSNSIIASVVLSSALLVTSASVNGAPEWVSPCSYVFESNSPEVFKRPGFPQFSEIEWSDATNMLKECTQKANVCVVNYNFGVRGSSVISARTVDDEALVVVPGSHSEQVLFAAVQVQEPPNSGCFVAVNGFSGAAPWFAEGWVLAIEDGSLIEHLTIEEMGRLGDMSLAAAPNEIASVLQKAYSQLVKNVARSGRGG